MRAFEDFVRAELARHRVDGLTPQQALFLLALEDRPRRLVDVVKAQRIVASNATYLVKSLVQTGFLERYPDPDDRRTAIIAPTPKAVAATELLRKALVPSPTEVHRLRTASAAAGMLETACSAETSPAPPVVEAAPAEPPARRAITRILLQPPFRAQGGHGR
ncbi:MarR family transcriptional regulator [Methylobacterium sp. 092160098-2]|uniref:MarR family transcriptional regulator n=1 Tax=Methylobacterium sp. 092160098-2 TaxID=3025129 RepID=UPI002381C6C3|nr:MarR family transcriptional regulator [Methylobacterium sp. 092160098-2]MDE4915060.1 MarR family transcriptional regulator [Methylobacterium sp. 092160098-2]